ncbi:pyridine nucleotide-disulfide oxidoreductase [Spirilliplanes yamanashiensis]|uniref:Pyridine nucleotide-disulfide oxidoreductase n=1 Tax=Spirilliplanes yamanashiensis TaxID=42233 RepID=A0A8J3Y569_9ACTN|nr:pyridine nucleotide-disulfide oxidoreductase [Spirilliplanes yamanashiensis]
MLAATQLLRCTDSDVILIDPDGPGGGVAYDAAQPWHLLNSRAGAMSAHPDDPGHFVAWARADGQAATADTFLARRTYGRYLRDVADAADAAAPGRLRVVRERVTGVAAHDTGVTVRAGDGLLHADRAVLAVGNPAGAQPLGAPAGHPAYIADPWRPDAFAAVPADGPVLLVGTGLTAVDVALTLATRGHRGPVVAVSRRGLLPQAHTAAGAPPALPDLDPAAGLAGLLHTLHAAACGAPDWRTVVDGLRPHLDRLWTGLTPAEQDRFLRHAARQWENHRHRMAPGIAAQVAWLRAEGALEVRAGTLAAVAADGAALTVTLADGTTTRYAAVVNCAGPGRLPAAAGPLVGALLTAGAARVGPHGLGLDVDAAGSLITAAGTAEPKLTVVGSLRRGRVWETTAVPEIRAQAAALAAASPAAWTATPPAAPAPTPAPTPAAEGWPVAA